jgi:glc operon protein GlcG
LTFNRRAPIIGPPQQGTIMLIRNSFVRAAVAILGLMLAAATQAQVPSYGPQVNLEMAKKMAAAAVVEAKKNGWPVAIAIVDNHGGLVYFEMLDDTQTASANIAIEKARTSAMFRRPTKVLEDAIAGGRVAVLGLPGATPIEGGLPIIVGGKVSGAIGVSGVTSQQDGQVAKAGLDALK